MSGAAVCVGIASLSDVGPCGDECLQSTALPHLPAGVTWVSATLKKVS